jgi:hypothetical protein
LIADNETKSSFNNFFVKRIKRLTDLQIFHSRKLLTFLFFVLISAILWLVRSLGEQYETDVTYPVRYINFPDNKVLIGKVPDKLKLRVKARGFSILKSKLNLNLVPLKFNVNSFSLNSIGKDTFYVVTETVKELLSAELDQITILDISPDTLFFRFTNMAVKKVAIRPVIAKHDKLFQKQYMQNGAIVVTPDSIIISGSQVVVENVRYIQTEPLNLNNLNDTVQVQCTLEQKDMITYSRQKVVVLIPVDRFTEVENTFKIIPVNVPDTLNMIAIPGQTSITYSICLSNYNKSGANHMIPHIDYNDFKEKQLTRLRVFLTDTPQIISNLRFNPKETEFLISRK